MRAPFVAVRPTDLERSGPKRGDDIVPVADVVMDRAFELDAAPAAIWPWLVQLGKQRAGWYLPRSVERFLPRSRRALRHLEPRWQALRLGDVIPDWGGADATFEVAVLDPPGALVYRSVRGPMALSWAITVTASQRPARSRVHLRLRLGPVRHVRLAGTVGGFFDLMTVVGLAAGLRERVPASEPSGRTHAVLPSGA